MLVVMHHMCQVLRNNSCSVLKALCGAEKVEYFVFSLSVKFLMEGEMRAKNVIPDVCACVLCD
jgi:hypothetical protein